jgi:hypothetical protein
MKTIQTLTALEMKRGKTYKVPKHLVPSIIVPLDNDDEYYTFSLDFVSECDGKAVISTNTCKIFTLPASQYVYECSFE